MTLINFVQTSECFEMYGLRHAAVRRPFMLLRNTRVALLKHQLSSHFSFVLVAPQLVEGAAGDDHRICNPSRS